jgi:hydroxypyruvate reductase
MERPAVLQIAPFPDFLTLPLNETYEVLDQIEPRVRAIVGAGGSVVTTAMLDALPNLEIIAVNGVGYDGVPVAACRERGIRVTNTPDVLTDDVADIAVALVLMTSRNLVRANRDLHSHHWAAGASRLTHSLRRKRVGIVGLGRIGRAIAARLAAFGTTIRYHGRTPQADVSYAFEPSLCDLARGSDFLVVIVPGGEGTKHLINAEVLAALGPAGTLINVARGSVVDEAALIAALQSNTIRGAGLDVFENEPHVPAALLAMENVVLLPHIGSATQETRRAMAGLVIDNLAAHFAGKALLTAVA